MATITQEKQKLKAKRAPDFSAPVTRLDRIFNHLSAFAVPLALLYLEWRSHLFLFGFSEGAAFFFGGTAALFFGCLLAYLTALFPKKAQRGVTIALLALFPVLFCFHEIYYRFFRSFFSWQTLGLAGDVTQFWRETLLSVLKGWYLILTAFLPLLLYLFLPLLFRRLGVKRNRSMPKFFRRVPLIFSVLFLALLILALLVFPAKRKRLYYLKSDLSAAYGTHGVIAASTVDLWQAIFGAPEEEVDLPEDIGDIFTPIIPKETSDPETNEKTTEPETGERAPVIEYNVMDLDFDALISSAPDDAIRDMHAYFSAVPPTRKNKYTGRFAGKNLIVMCLEGFSDKVITREMFPTLWKMRNEGFVFNNFYHSIWGGSTATGEYSVMTGNFYATANCLSKSADTLQYFSFGNLFSRAGYRTFAYHNNSYTYYSRNLSHPNFGYRYRAIGNGLKLPTSTWPNSDYEMALVTGPEYIQEKSDQPFHAYYMTVSGHGYYSWGGNAMSARHRNDLIGWDSASEGVKAYVASQYEVELMCRELIDQLEKAGQLENTVFALCCDHYPYALSDEELSELYQLPLDDIRGNFDLYRNSFILWCADMEEPVFVDAPCSSYDILPTVANLFGVEYDSRVITGKDVFGVEDNLAVINTMGRHGSWNWTTTQGTYDTLTHTFTPSASCLLTEDQIPAYVEQCKLRVSAMRKYSYAILDRDYYRYLFG